MWRERVSITEQIKELTECLNVYRDAYYNKSESMISDYEYDNLLDELKTLEEATGIVMANSPTHTVGYEVKSNLEKVKHSHLMMSLDKTKDINDLIKFAGDNDCLLMHKLDGLTILLTYENGKLIQAETRGSGEIGELVTHNAKTFQNIPLTIPYRGHYEIEGEAIITYSDFNKINSVLPEDKKYKNPRNLVSGSVRQLDSEIAAKRNIKFIAWKIPTDFDECNTMFERLKAAEKFGFEIVSFYTYTNNSSDKDNIGAMTEALKSRADKLGIPIDGLVMAYNDIKYGESLGITGHHPKHSLAYKFYEEEASTTLRKIEWSIGKTGCLTPVAIFDEVDLEGTTVCRASLHNVSIIKELQLGINDEITVYKANAIIPQIRDNLTRSNNLEIPEKCPVCGGRSEIFKDNDTEVLMCTNPYCKTKLVKRLAHFVSIKGMDIDGLSEETLSKFVDLGWITNLFDIYGSLHIHYPELVKMNGFGKRSVEKLDIAIENSKDVELKKFIAALSIPGIGTSQSKELAKKFKTWDEFSEAGFGNYDFSKLDGFGDVLNRNIHTWFKTMWNEDRVGQMVRNMRFKDNTPPIAVAAGTIDLSGKSFVITGSLNHFENRDAAKAEIEAHNGKVTGSVTSKSFALVNNDINSNSSKNKKAKELGVQIISEEQLIKMLG